MGKSNVLIYALLLACSIALLCIWYVFGFDAYNPTPYYAIIGLWWVVIIVCAIIFVRSELSRRRAIRTIYVSKNRLYNLEYGLVSVQGANYVGSISGILSRLRYGFSSKSVPNLREMGFKYVVHTKKYADNGAVWSGDVKNVDSKRTRWFSSPEQLAEILSF